jgi:flagellar motility protein MotE (MotC chaperone)
MRYLSPTRLLPLTIAAIAVVLIIRVGGIAETATAACATPAACGTPPASTSAGVSPAPPAAAPTGTPAAAAAPDFSPPRFAAPTDGDKALLEDLRNRSGQIDARETALAQREATAAATEKRLGERFGELSALASRLEALEKSLKERDQANWDELVKLYENMKPRDAATIFNDLNMAVLLEVMDRMKPLKAAPIMAAMNPDKARQVTADLASKRTASVNLSN